MKRFMFLVVSALLMGSTLAAQNETAGMDNTTEEFDRYFEARMQLDFRNFMLKTLDLSEQEIVAIDPLLAEYMNERAALSDRKYELVKEYRAEMKEDDTAKDEAEESSDFIENYWELSIKESKLKERYFDRFEEKIPYQKAFEFFVVENEIQNQMMRPVMIQTFPVILEIEKLGKTESESWEKDSSKTTSYRKNNNKEKNWAAKSDKKQYGKMRKNRSSADMESKKRNQNTSYSGTSDKNSAIEAFYAWVEKDDEKVALDHQYTHDGLTALAAVVRQMNKEYGVFSNADVYAKTMRLETIADKLQDNWKSTKHADWAREAFVLVADMMDGVSNNATYADASDEIDKLSEIARNINPDVLMTDQGATIRNFFDKTRTALTAIENCHSKSEYTRKK